MGLKEGIIGFALSENIWITHHLFAPRSKEAGEEINKIRFRANEEICYLE